MQEACRRGHGSYLDSFATARRGKRENMSENLHVGVAGVYRFVEILDTRYLMRRNYEKMD